MLKTSNCFRSILIPANMYTNKKSTTFLSLTLGSLYKLLNLLYLQLFLFQVLLLICLLESYNNLYTNNYILIESVLSYDICHIKFIGVT